MITLSHFFYMKQYIKHEQGAHAIDTSVDRHAPRPYGISTKFHRHTLSQHVCRVSCVRLEGIVYKLAKRPS